jgi:hypothetical protein
VIEEVLQIEEVIPILRQAWTWILDQVWLWILLAIGIFVAVGRRSPAQENLDRYEPPMGL